MRTSKQEFKKGIEKAFSRDIKVNPETTKDAVKYISSFNENSKKGRIPSKLTFNDLVKKHEKHGKNIDKLLKSQLNKGIKVEMEHVKRKEDKELAKKIAMDHLYEDPRYYDKLKKIENKEATSSVSVGSFLAPIEMKEQGTTIENLNKFLKGVASVPEKIKSLVKVKSFAEKKSKQFYPNDDLKQDPYRHMLASAIVMKNFGFGITELFAQSVEILGAMRSAFKNQVWDSGWEQDMKNNKIGMSLGVKYSNMSDDQLSLKVKEMIDNNDFFDVNGNPIGKNKDIVANSVKKIETNEMTTTASVGSYLTPAAWAKSTNKKDWGAKNKPQIPGGSFVSIKKKCKKFPYCNQGDIKALNLYEKDTVKEAIRNLSYKMNISENTIKAIIQYELENRMKKK